MSPQRTIAGVARAGGRSCCADLGRRLEETGGAAARLPPRSGSPPPHSCRSRRGGRTFGVMSCGFVASPSPDHERETLSLLEDLGQRARRWPSRTRGSTPSAPTWPARCSAPSCRPTFRPSPGVELAARYRPAGEGNEVGGDFYDCFATRDGD